MDVFQQWLIEEHRRRKIEDTMIGHLLTLQESQPHYYTDEKIKGLVMNMLGAGTDTTTVTIEWAMSVLLNHPEYFQKARAELDAYVGCDRLVAEEDLSKLHYLQCIINETLRRFPATPLLLPHQSLDDCQVGGYDVPRGTMVLVNVWAIHREPEVWAEPTKFKPERFLSEDGEAKNLLTFGMGRRACPGAGLGKRIVGLVLATLIQCFEWERIGEKEVDLSEGSGLTMPKAKPLEAMCKVRQAMQGVLSQALHSK